MSGGKFFAVFAKKFDPAVAASGSVVGGAGIAILGFRTLLEGVVPAIISSDRIRRHHTHGPCFTLKHSLSFRDVQGS